MYCQNCGSRLVENQKFCTSCGRGVVAINDNSSSYQNELPSNSNASLMNEQQNVAMANQNVVANQPNLVQSNNNNSNTMFNQPISYNNNQFDNQSNLGVSSKNKNFLFIGIGVASLAIIAVIAFFALSIFGSNTFETPVIKMVEAMNKKNVNIYLEAYPSFMRDDVKEDVQYNMEKLQGLNIMLNYEITGKTELDEYILDELQNELKEKYNFNGKLKEGYTLGIILKSDGRKVTDGWVDVVKIGNKWYFID